MTRRIVRLVVAAACAGSPAQAQTAQNWSLQSAIHVSGVAGDVYRDLRVGYGVEVGVRRSFSAWSVGGGVLDTRHPVAGFSRDASILGIFLEPRYVVAVFDDQYALYAGPRFSLLRQSLDAKTGSASATGASASAGGGALMSLTDRVHLDVGGLLGVARFTGTKIRSGGEIEQGAGGWGRFGLLRLGVVVGVGRASG